MIDTTSILEWVEAVCVQADKEVQESQSPAFLNKMAKSGGAFPYFYNNVHTRRAMSAEQFGKMFPNYIKELAEVKVEYDAREVVVDTAARVVTLEAKFDALQAQITEALAQLQPAKPASKSGKKVKQVSDPEPETGDNDHPEGEAPEGE